MALVLVRGTSWRCALAHRLTIIPEAERGQSSHSPPANHDPLCRPEGSHEGLLPRSQDASNLPRGDARLPDAACFSGAPQPPIPKTSSTLERRALGARGCRFETARHNSSPEIPRLWRPRGQHSGASPGALVCASPPGGTTPQYPAITSQPGIAVKPWMRLPRLPCFIANRKCVVGSPGPQVHGLSRVQHPRCNPRLYPPRQVLDSSPLLVVVSVRCCTAPQMEDHELTRSIIDTQVCRVLLTLSLLGPLGAGASLPFFSWPGRTGTEQLWLALSA